MMASFICPNEHLSILFGEKVSTTTLPSDAIFGYSDLAIRVKRILQLYYQGNSNDREVDKMIRMMESLSFYYQLNDEEQQLYKPDTDNNSNTTTSNPPATIPATTRSEKYYLFPSFRPSNGQFTLPTIDKDYPYPHYTLAVRYSRTTSTTNSNTTSNISGSSSPTSLFIPPYIFSQLQVLTRRYHAKKNQIYSNGMKLFKDSNEAWILPNTHVSTKLIKSIHFLPIYLIVYEQNP